jgi:hypothetical protein
VLFSGGYLYETHRRTSIFYIFGPPAYCLAVRMRQTPDMRLAVQMPIILKRAQRTDHGDKV